jgi:hypothetical protein
MAAAAAAPKKALPGNAVLAKRMEACSEENKKFDEEGRKLVGAFGGDMSRFSPMHAVFTNAETNGKIYVGR